MIGFQADIANLLFQPKGNALMTAPTATSNPLAWPEPPES